MEPVFAEVLLREEGLSSDFRHIASEKKKIVEGSEGAAKIWMHHQKLVSSPAALSFGTLKYEGLGEGTDAICGVLVTGNCENAEIILQAHLRQKCGVLSQICQVADQNQQCVGPSRSEHMVLPTSSPPLRSCFANVGLRLVLPVTGGLNSSIHAQSAFRVHDLCTETQDGEYFHAVG